MGKHDWYRRTTWSPTDQADFFARLKRSRTRANRAQYLRIQASYLAEANHHTEAIQLLDQLLREEPQDSELAQAHLQKAQSFAALHHTDDAIVEFRQSLATERSRPTCKTACWLEFGWFVIVQNLTKLFDEVLAVFAEYEGRVNAILLAFPGWRYRHAAVYGIIAHTRGENDKARRFARIAIESAGADRSGIPYHQDMGLVVSIDPNIQARLQDIVRL